MRKLLATLYLITMAATSFAASGDLLLEADLAINKFAVDRTKNIIYASMKDNTVAVLDIDAANVKAIIPVGTSPQGMAVSWDNTKLYVAVAGATRLEVIDLETYDLLAPYSLPYTAADVEVDFLGRIYVVPSSTFAVNTVGAYTMRVIDPATSSFTDINCSACYSAILEMSTDGRTLFAANRGLSPGTLEKFDVSGSGSPLSIWRNAHGSLGSNGQDLWLTHNDKHIYYAMGSGNQITGYDIAQIDAETLAVNGTFNTGPYPREIITSQDGKTAYAVHTSGHIDVWDAERFTKIKEYGTIGEAHELIISKGFLLAAFVDKLRVYEAEPETAPPVVADADNDGIADTSDNCLNDSNSDQSDVDGDGIGDVCDPYPNQSNHALGECSANLAAANSALNACNAELKLYK